MKSPLMTLALLLTLSACGVSLEETTTAVDDGDFAEEALAATATPNVWQELSAAQHQAILAGQQVRIDGTNPNVWQVTYYQWIKHLAPQATPRGAAAVYWDLPGQVSYQPGLVAFDIVSGEGNAVMQAAIDVTYPDPTTGQAVSSHYEQQNTLARSGSGYLSAWHTTNPDAPFTPLTPVMTGDVLFVGFPGDGGGALMKYRVIMAPVPALIANAALKEFALSSFSYTVQAHVTRMQQGATDRQLRRLANALR